MSIQLKKNKVLIDCLELSDSTIYEYLSGLSTKEEQMRHLLAALKLAAISVAAKNKPENYFIRLFHSSDDERLNLHHLRALRMRNVEKEKSSGKGVELENILEQQLKQYLRNVGYADSVMPSGTMRGKIARNKTGDLLCSINDDENLLIAIESKYANNYTIGHLGENCGTERRGEAHTAVEQLLETSANRDAKMSLMVFDRNNAASIIKEVNALKYLPGIGFIVIVDIQSGRYENLLMAYELARMIVLSPCYDDIIKKNQMQMILDSLTSEYDNLADLQRRVENHKKSTQKMQDMIENQVQNLKAELDYLKAYALGTADKTILDFYLRKLI